MKNRGITLISLVVTIIILVILAGISISMILGNEGLLNKAKYATESYSNAQQQEELELAKYSNDINSYVSGNRDYETEIKQLKARIEELENANQYSTTKEIVIGTWTDGKPIYQKTYNISSISSSSSGTINISDISYETIVNISGTAKTSDNEILALNASHSTNVIYQFFARVNGNSSTLCVYTGSGVSLNNINITLQYTKTTPNTNE